MKKLLTLLFVNIAHVTSAKVVTLYYGPNHDGKYLEIILHGDKAIAWQHESISRYSHSRVEKLLNDSHLWRIKFAWLNESDSTLVYNNTAHQPIRKRLIFSNDLSELEIKDLRPDAALPSEKLTLVDIHIDPRAGRDDYIGDPKLRVKILDPKDKSSDNKD